MKAHIIRGILLLSVFTLLAGGILLAEGAREETSYKSYMGKHDPVWKLSATDGLLIGGYGDNFAYDGTRVVPIGGKAVVDINAETDQGYMEVVFNGTISPERDKSYSGEIKIVYESFDEGSDFWEGGIADFVYLHGDTGQEAPVMPQVKSDLASWGPADIYVDGELIYDDLVGHMMYTERSRSLSNYAITNSDGSGYYSPKDPGNASLADPDAREIHFVAHTTEQDKGNFPPHTVWVHLNFTTVKETS